MSRIGRLKSGIFPAWIDNPEMRSCFLAAIGAAHVGDAAPGTVAYRGRIRQLLHGIRQLEKACDRGVSLDPQQMQKIRRKPALCELQAMRRARSADVPLCKNI